ncbi:ACP S-malonyltransferase [Candidatus Babeliales bacterium]|nr:ACP S-malonyltransferase [Candidatus Babeliales bacterium]
MKKIGMLFPGQGAQTLGMGKEFYDKERVVQELFEEASNCLDNNFVRLCFASSDNELRGTVNAQASIFLVSTAIAQLLKERYGVQPDIVAGHSSGEYAALFAAGGMTFPDALYLLKKRATFMEEATLEARGTMVAVIGLSYDKLNEICKKHDVPESLEHVAQIVNYNNSKQLVVSGTVQTLEKVIDDARAAGGKIIELDVAGAFHSRLMDNAAQQFAQYMVKVDFKDLHVPLVTNVDAAVATTGAQVHEALQKHMNSPVLWWPSMQHFKDCDVIIEVGPGIAYAKMLRREWPDKEIISINDQSDIEKLLEILGKVVEKHEHKDGCNAEYCAEDELVVVEPVVEVAQEVVQDAAPVQDDATVLE